MRYRALDAIFRITSHSGVFGKTQANRQHKYREVKRPAFGRQGLRSKPPTFMLIPMEGRISLRRMQLDSNLCRRVGPYRAECYPRAVAPFISQVPIRPILYQLTQIFWAIRRT